MRENGSLLEEGRKERREEVFPTIPPHPTSIIHRVLAFKFFFEFRIKSPKSRRKSVSAESRTFSLGESLERLTRGQNSTRRRPSDVHASVIVVFEEKPI